MKRNYKLWIGIGTALILAAILWNTVGKNADNGTLSVERQDAASPVGRELLSLLLELKAIDLDESLFSDPAFKGLEDFSQALEPQPVGRLNPFAPLGSGEGE